ncbi:hypothetical protein P9Z59_26500 [Bacillus thuringiensis]|uniref:DUF4064 domain-containing protein n=1 Tax=Bacillus thuringiensis subsp. tolworthi TaxID=1442 RepID=A0A9W4EWA7_BACTO|nr:MULTISPECIES: hypothetical protein [Bacillus cereus group]KAB1364754.1 hypothetical protein FPG89_30495 [Bacillus thuringiensis]KIP28954.1 hypothetical protein BG10_4177 [Bacillus thuringiensis serovar morrisoni]MCT6942857.1 hypothetical protein [Bacillus thuringiensis]MDA2525023.1 hypothetical protein [Bacillus cereus]MDA2560985.1 hypothetical protein [Bacillus cereus]
MKRTTEFVTGLIGGIFGVICSFIVMLWAGGQPVNEDNGLFVTSIIVLVLQLTALTLSCLVNKLNNKVYGIISIAIGLITLFLSALIFFIPAILQFVSGGLAFKSQKETI